jgi:hypothetical protein
MEHLADVQDYHSVFGEDPHYIHLEDGRRVEFALVAASRIAHEFKVQAFAREGAAVFDAPGRGLKPICPGCTVTVSFNVMSIIGRENGHNPVQIADAMIRLWSEVKERGEFFTSERSGILPVQEKGA